jgi:hypothetical protein
MNRRFFIISVIVSVLALAGALQVTPTQAMSISGGSIALTCTQAYLNLKYHADRNNTGTGKEHYAYIITDGVGTVLARQEYTDNFDAQDDFTKTFSPAPQYNPIVGRMVSFAGNGLPEVNYYTTTYDCAGLPQAPFSGPALPSSFELRTITCTVAVFQTPGGIPVPSGEKIIGGQTWYVNPKPVKGSDGKSWTEIFVASDINGYIPTSCVGR